jgi:hypothetical protein
MLERPYLQISCSIYTVYDDQIINYLVSAANFNAFCRFQYERRFVRKLARKVAVVVFAFVFALSIKGPLVYRD